MGTADFDRDYHYSSKIDVANDLDNIHGDQHEVCPASGFGHNSEMEILPRATRNAAECYVLNVNKRSFYALSWQEIADADNEDEFLIDLKTP